MSIASTRGPRSMTSSTVGPWSLRILGFKGGSAERTGGGLSKDSQERLGVLVVPKWGIHRISFKYTWPLPVSSPNTKD